MTRFGEAVLMLMGMIIGVGMFGIPFVFVKAGFWLGTIELAVLAAVILTYHLLYSSIVLHTAEFHRLPGYARLYLGRPAVVFAWGSAFLGIGGSLVAYLALGSTFLNTLTQTFFTGNYESLWVFGFVLCSAAVTFLPMKKEVAVTGVSTSLLIVLILVLVTLLAPRVQTGNFSGIHFSHLFVPYGVLLFALSGGLVIPDLVTLLDKNPVVSRRAIIIGSLLPAVLYFLFAWAVVGTVGADVTEEAIQGIARATDHGVLFFGSAIGLLAVFNAFTVLSSSFHRLLRLDVHLPNHVAWVTAYALPLSFYFLGVQNFISVISIVGAVSIGIDSALVITMYRVMRGKMGIRTSGIAALGQYLLYGMIIAGVVYELYMFFVTMR